jgi:hypothetical protein
MSGRETNNLEVFKKGLIHDLSLLYKKHNIEMSKNIPISSLFKDLIIELSKVEKVVVLIDEYDKPLLDHLFNKDKLSEFREFLRNFYSTLKDLDPYLRFVFITGISKFSKVGVFSALNNLNDISLDDDFSNFLGHTQKEVELYFNEYINHISKEKCISKNNLLEDIKLWYDGYSFNGKNFVYNPFSLLNYFSKSEFRNYWFTSGSPKFIVDYSKKNDLINNEMENIEVFQSFYDKYEIESAPYTSFLFQAGYLTIKNKITIGNLIKYVLSFPNLEVKQSFNELLMENVYKVDDFLNLATDINVSLIEDNTDLLIETFKKMLSSIPYNLFSKKESFYHASIYSFLLGAGINAKCEEMTNNGRSDIVIETKNKTYIIELKTDKVDVSINQIKEKGYDKKYSNPVLIGLQIDFKRRNIVDFKIENV